MLNDEGRTPADRFSDSTYVPQRTAAAGQLIAGRYKFIEQIGEGGMGTVWLADQKEPVRRRVAVKLIKAGMDSAQVLYRFEAERQALAILDHPNIAKVFDGGRTEDDRPFFVMEYVKGIPLTDFCDREKLRVRDRLQLLISVCQAVQHAHQKGIIHRDLKPSNILVSMHEGKAVPKVIDFGLAKAFNQSLTENTLHTALGTMLGTPMYMSPEQAEQNNLDIDTRTDIYSLGVILYELLTGVTPIERQAFRDAALNEMLRLIREVEPPRPSTRLSSIENLPNVAASRGIDPRSLNRELHGDLDWIVMKAIEKERGRRYETADGFARDIQRFLAFETVEATPPRLGYRLRKLYQRRKQIILISGVLLGLLLTACVVSIWQAIRATKAEGELLVHLETESVLRTRAETARDRLRSILDLMTSSVTREALLTQLRLTKEQETLLNDIVRYYEELAIEDSADSDQRLRVGTASFRVGEIQFRLGRFSDAKTSFEHAYEILSSMPDNSTESEPSKVAAAAALVRLAFISSQFGDRTGAIETHKRALACFETVKGPAASSEIALQHKANCQSSLGLELIAVGNNEEALQYCNEAIRTMGDKSNELSSRSVEFRVQLARCFGNRGIVLERTVNIPNVIEDFMQARQILETMTEESSGLSIYGESLAKTYNNLGFMNGKVGRWEESIGYFRKAVEIRGLISAMYPGVFEYKVYHADTEASLAEVLFLRGNRDEAMFHSKHAIEILRSLKVPDSGTQAFNRQLLRATSLAAGYASAMNRPEEALSLAQESVDIAHKLSSEYAEVVDYAREEAVCLNNLARVSADFGLIEDSIRHHTEALRIRTQLCVRPESTAGDLQNRGMSLNNLGSANCDACRFSDAVVHLEEAYKIRYELWGQYKSVPSVALDLSMTCINLAELHRLLKDNARALELLKQAEEVLNSQPSETHTSDEGFSLLQRARERAMARVLIQAGENLPPVDEIRQLLKSDAKWQTADLLDAASLAAVAGTTTAYSDEQKSEISDMSIQHLKAAVQRGWRPNRFLLEHPDYILFKARMETEVPFPVE
ncbi:MAG: serine/threonine protein kinase [Planctomyces sp.]|nr:serine/threonine protein kinase [Planctomyces sp.]